MTQDTPTTPSTDDPAQNGVLTADTGAQTPDSPEEALTGETTDTDKPDDALPDDGARISPKHRAYLVGEGISAAYLDRYATLIRTSRVLSDLPEELRWVGDPRGILFGWKGLDGSLTWQFRPDTPPVDDEGREMKYLFPKGSVVRGGVLIRGEVEEVPGGSVFAPAPRPLIIVEGTKQGHAASSAILTEGATGRRRHTLDRADVLGIPGCWGWSEGKSAPSVLRDFARGRKVFVVLDADAATNRRVYDAGIALSRELGEAESTRFIHVPGAGKSGLDDWIKTVPSDERLGALEELAADASPRPAQKRPHPKSSLMGAAMLDGVEFDPFTPDGQFRPTSTARFLIKRRHYALMPGGMLATYRDGYYAPSDKQLAADLVDLLGDMYTTGHYNNVESIISALCHKHDRRVRDSLSEPLVNCQNGMLDMRTGELLPHDPSYLLLRQVAVEWNPDADTSAWDSWCAERVGAAQQPVMEEALSQMLDPSRAPNKALFLFGPTRSGKSTIGNIATALCGGDEFVSAVGLEALGEQFAAADLFGKALNAAMDLPDGYIPDLSMFKKLLGNDLIYANEKYGKTFNFHNRALPLFSANTLPTVGDMSGAYEARVIPVAFPRSYLGNENPEVEAALMASLDGILLRIVQGWQRRYQRGMGGQSWSPIHPEVSARFREDSDRVSRYIAAATVTDFRAPAEPAKLMNAGAGGVQGPATKSQTYEHFKAWVASENGKAMGRKKFIERLLSTPGVSDMRHPVTSARVLSIGLLPEDEWRDVPPYSDLADLLLPPLGNSDPKTAQNINAGQAVFSGVDGQNGQKSPETPRDLSVSDSASPKEVSLGGFPTEPAYSAQAGVKTASDQVFPSGQFLSSPRQPLPEPFHLLSTDTLALLDARGHHATQWGGSPEQVREMGRDQGPCFTLDELRTTAVDPDIHPDRLRAMVQLLFPVFAQHGVVLAERRLALPTDEKGTTAYLGEYDPERKTPQTLDAAHTAYASWLMPGWQLPLPTTSQEN